MKLLSQPKTSLLASLLGGLSAFVLGCVITVGPGDDAGAETSCGDPLTNSFLQGDVCYCEVGFEWCNPNDPNDYDCCEYSGKEDGECDGPNNTVVGGTCYCTAGYTWCNPSDPDDYSCCESGHNMGTGGTEGTEGTDTEGTGGTETEGGTTDAETGDLLCLDLDPVPTSCDPEVEFAFCTSTTMECLEQSEYFTCDAGGNWQPTDGDPDCQFAGFDFSYGCIDDGELVDQVCGTGPGTPCANSEPDACADDDALNYCLYGKLGSVSCLVQCTEVGDEEGVQYDFGSCGEQDGEFKCLCCDFDEEGCGVDSDSDTDTDTDTL